MPKPFWNESWKRLGTSLRARLHSDARGDSHDQAPARRRALILDELEDRVLLSATPLPAPAPTASQQAPLVDPALSVQMASAAPPTGTTLNQAAVMPTAPVAKNVVAPPLPTAQATTVKHELVFVDSGVQDLQQVLNELHSPRSNGRQIDVVVIDDARDGIQQISQALATRHNLDAVHFISHSTDHNLKLGGTWLDASDIDSFASQIRGWASSLNAGADLLFYGCDLAKNDAGQALLRAIGRDTGADVAASTDVTASATMGGNWNLEYRIGQVDTSNALSQSFEQSWTGELATFTVTNANDSGAGSLRDAITNANAAAGADTITFNIAGAGVHTINVLSTLPTVTEAVTIDGTTQPGYAGTPLIQLNGASAGTGADGISISSGGSTIRGLTINRFTGNGIYLSGSGGNTIVGNYIGTNAAGTADSGNGGNGIFIDGVASNVIGGATAADGNVISGNDGYGIYILNAGATGNTIQGNSIGVNASGGGSIGNTGAGIWISDASSNTIGGTSAGMGNIIANTTAGNGVTVIGSSINDAVEGNSIYGNSGLGIDLGNDGVTANDNLDPDSGPNSSKNFPIITAATSDGIGSITIDGTVNTVATHNLRIEFFASPTANASGYGEGQIYLGYVNVTTDASGNANFSATLSAAVPAGYAITATNTDLDNGGDTSEFSAALVARGNTGLWISSPSNGAAGGITWNDGTIVQFGDPNLSFEPGTTTGAFYKTEFDLNNFAADGAVNLNGIHFVSRTVTVGSANAVTLQAGDLLLSTASNETLGGVAVSINDIILFRPTTPGDYSSGTFSVLLENPMGGTGTRDFALVETATVVGGVTLQAGDFLLTDRVAAYYSDVSRYQVTDVGPGTTSGTLSELIDGQSAGIGFNQEIYGLELVQTSTTLGGTALTAGQLLISLNAADTVGTNSLSVTQFDIFVLTVTATGAGTSSASAALLVQGSDIGLSAAGEEYDAIALLPLPQPTNTAPVLTSNGGGATANINVAENSTAVTTVTATDSDLPVQTLTYSISGGADAAKFAINSSTGSLSFISAPDFENPTDAGANNVYNVTVQVSDGSLTDSQAIAVTVTAVNDNTPVITSDGGGATANINVAENSTAVTTVTATDADLPVQTLTYSISGGADAAKFAINSATGALTFVSAPDFENPTDAGVNNIYNVTVQISDGSLTDSQAIAVTVTAVNDNTPVITSDGGGATANINVAENTTAVTTVTATDADLPAQTLTYSVSGGADAAKFTIDSSTGALSFIAAPDYENPTDVNADNVYDVIVQVSDGSQTGTQALAVTVTPVNDNAPVITSNGGGATANINVAENSTAVTTVTATDADLPAQTRTYSISGGADAAKFSIDSSTGALSLIAAPDYENPTDAVNADNVYDVIVQVSDGSQTDTQAIFVTVTNVNESPVQSLPSPQTTNENTALVFSTAGGNGIAISDVDAAGGQEMVSLNVTNGTLTLAATSGLTITGGANGSSAVTFTGTLANINAALDGLSYSPTASYGGAAVLNISTNDQGNTGSGGAQSTSGAVNITVVAVNDPPVVSVPGGQTANEDNSIVFSVGNGNAITVSDIDDAGAVERISLSITSGTLTLGSTTGLTITAGANGSASLTFTGTLANINAALNGLTYTPTANFNGADTLNLTANDLGNTGTGGAKSDSQSVSLTLNAVNDAPVLVAPATASTSEDTTLVFSTAGGNAISISDVDSGGASERLSLSVTSGTLTLSSLTGLTITAGANGSSALTFTGTLANINAALDGLTYTPAANFNGAATLSVSASDLGNSGSGGALTASATVSITVTAVNDPPSIAQPAAQNTNEDVAVVFSTSGGNAITIADPDGGGAIERLTLSVTSGTLTLASTSGLTITAGASGSGSVTFSGLLTDINAALDGLTYRPAVNYNGVDTLNITANDLSNTGAGGPQTTVASVTINLAAVNDAPTNATPGSQTMSEDNTLTFSSGTGNAISIADPDAGVSTVRASLSVAHGRLTLNGTAGLTITAGANGSGAMSFTGTLANINAALDGLQYAPDPNFSGADTFTIVANDLGNSGAGGPLTASSSVSIRISAVNDAPTLTVPSANATHGSALRFDGVNSIVRVNDNASLRMTNTVTVEAWVNPQADTGQNQVILNKEGEYEIARLADGALGWAVANTMPGWNWTSTGVQVPLNQWTHVAVAYNAGVTSIYINGNLVQTNVGSGSIGDQYPALNDLTIGGRQNTTGQRFDGFIDDVRVWSTARTQPQIQASMNQTLTGNEAGLAANWQFDEASGGVASDVSPNANTGSLGVGNPASAPVWVNYNALEDTAYVFSTSRGNAIVLADVDAGNSSEQMTLSAAHGTLTLASSTGLTFSAGANGSGSMTITGTLADINAALDGLTYQADSNYNGSETISISASDLGNTGNGAPQTVSKSFNMNVAAVNDLPVVTFPPEQTAAPSVVFSAANGNAIQISDVDIGAGTLQVTLSAAGGTVMLSNPSGVTFIQGSGAEASMMTFTGTLAQINAALDGMTFRAHDASAQIQISLVDLGSSGPPTNPTVSAVAPIKFAAPSLPTVDTTTRSTTTTDLVAADSGRLSRHQTTVAAEQAAQPANSAPSPASRMLNRNGGGTQTDRAQSDSESTGPVSFSANVLTPGVIRSSSSSRTRGLTLNTLGAKFDMTQFWGAFDQIQKSLPSRGATFAAAGALTGVSLSLSAGYLIWLIRGGSLMASAVATLPMWRFIDPMPILDAEEQKSKRRGKDEPRDAAGQLLPEETFETMLN